MIKEKGELAMDKSAIQNELRYIIAKEQYMKQLLENQIITWTKVK